MEKYKNIAFRKLLKLLGNRRPSSAPFVSGDSFRALADHVHDETGSFDPKSVGEKDLVFVRSDMLHDYFKTIHPDISAKYVLISHNSDENIDERYAEYLDDRIVHWFAQNALFAHPKLTPIPIGLDNLYFSYVGDTSFFRKMRSRLRADASARKNRILYGFSVNTNPAERSEALAALKKTGVADETRGFVPFHEYIRVLVTYGFVASPPGNGIDSPRQWQGMYLGCIPVLKANANTDYFVSLGLPILRVERWEELQEMSEEQLSGKYDEIMRSADDEPLWMDYWIKKIRHGQE